MSVFIAAVLMAAMAFIGITPSRADALTPPCLLTGTQLNTCDLTFVSQPASAQAQATIPGVPGPFVSVQVTFGPLGGVGGVAVTLTPTPGATISGNTVTSDANGVATFTGLSIVEVGHYTLTATANNSKPASSDASGFDVHDVTTFAAQPTSAQTGTTITSVPGNPSGAPVQVQVSPVPQSPVVVTLTPTPAATISGNTATTDANGLATFPALSIAQEGHYTLTATAANSTSVTSNDFTVYDDATFCSANTTCSASATSAPADGTTVTATVSSSQNTNGGSVFVSEGLDSVSCLAPSGSYQPARGVATSDSTFSGTGYKIVTIRIAKSVVLAVDPFDPNGASKFQVCYQDNVTAPTGSVLPDCGSTTGAPCVSHRNKNKVGDAIIELHLPLSDPKYGFCVSGSTCVVVG